MARHSKIKVIGGCLLFIALLIWVDHMSLDPKHPHCGNTTKWFLIQPPLIPNSPGAPKDLSAPLWKWQIASCYTSAADCNSYRLQRDKEWGERKEAGLNKADLYFKGVTEEYAAARCVSVNDAEIVEAVKLHGPCAMPGWGNEEGVNDE